MSTFRHYDSWREAGVLSPTCLICSHSVPADPVFFSKAINKTGGEAEAQRWCSPGSHPAIQLSFAEKLFSGGEGVGATRRKVH